MLSPLNMSLAKEELTPSMLSSLVAECVGVEERQCVL